MIEYISGEDEQKRVREEICRSWESFWTDGERMTMMAKDLLCSTVLPPILTEEFNKIIKEHGFDFVEVQPMEPPKKL